MRGNIRPLLRVAAVAALAFSVTGEAGGAEIKISGIYSDLHLIAEAGDLLGTEIMTIHRVRSRLSLGIWFWARGVAIGDCSP